MMYHGGTRQGRHDMTRERLAITGGGRSGQVELDPEGLLIGRSPQCDLSLPDRHVSTEHARVFQDPFGRWIVEDLGSKNGVWVDGQRITARALLPGERVVIGPYTLSLTTEPDSRIQPDTDVAVTTSVLTDLAHEEMIETAAVESETLSLGRIEQLNRIGDRLSGVSKSSRLYSELCEALADSPRTAAVVLRVPAADEPLPSSPPILACHIAGRPDEFAAHAMANLHLSRRALEAARSCAGPVTDSSTYTSPRRP